MTNQNDLSNESADIGDYLKLIACTAVMLQTILSLCLQTNPTIKTQMRIGITYNLVKFTAPAFIFGILYTTTRTTINSDITYAHYLRKQWHASFVPTIWWTSIYLLVMPWLQQVSHYHHLAEFCWQFINGNAAPHLWYNTMMLQFIVLMPVFWGIGRFSVKSPHRGITVAVLTTVIAVSWLLFYDKQVFHGPHMTDWYLLDRFFLSFIIFGVFGTLAWQFRCWFNYWLKRWWPLLILALLISFYWTNQELFAFQFPVKLTNAPYYKPSMLIYDLSAILLIAAIARSQIDHHHYMTNLVHLFANFAYKAFLSNVFWDQLLWLSFGKSLTIQHPLLGILAVYVGTWCLSFASAFTIHWRWHRLQVAIISIFKSVS